jgi:uncharacterized protein (TIGR02391 family)
MLDAAIKAIFTLYPTADRLINAPQVELEQVLLQYTVAVNRMITHEGIANTLLGPGGYEVDADRRQAVRKAIGRAWKALENSGLIEEPDPANGKNGYRVASDEGKRANTEFDFAAAKTRGRFERDMFHPLLPDAAWNAFSIGNYDTAVFEAFKAVEVTVRTKGGFGSNDYGSKLMDKAFDPTSGPFSDQTALPGQRLARRDLFKGAFGELRNPKAHRNPSITDPLIAVEEMMMASVLLRIVS